jgi:hypothetical protein
MIWIKLRKAVSLLPHKTFIADGVGIGFQKRLSHVDRSSFEAGNVEPDNERDISHHTHGSSPAHHMMVPHARHRALLENLVMSSSSTSFPAKKRVSREAYTKLVTWINANGLSPLEPYLRVSEQPDMILDLGIATG